MSAIASSLSSTRRTEVFTSRIDFWTRESGQRPCAQRLKRRAAAAAIAQSNRGHHYVLVVVSSSPWLIAIATRACSNCGGNARPRFAARRNIPRQARGER